MKLPKSISKERIMNGLKSFGKLRIKTDHTSILVYSALALILFITFTIRMFPLRWEIGTGTFHLSEFDPYYQFSLTRYMVDHGLFSPYWPTQWVDTQRWYPDGINMGVSLSSLPMTTAILFNIVSALGFNIDLMSFCSVMPAVMATAAVFVIYLLGKDIGGRGVGLLASLFLALNGSFIQRTTMGFYDTEVVGIFSLVLFSFLFLRAIDENRPINSVLKYSIGSAAVLAYFILGWGAAYYLVGLVVLFTFVMLLLRRYSRRLLLVYSITFGLGLLVSIPDAYIGPRYLTSFVVLPVAAVFVLLCLNEILRNLSSAKAKIISVIVFLAAIIGGIAALQYLGYIPDIAGKFWSVLNPFQRESTPLIESVAEHKLSAWGSIYFDLGIVILFFGTGLFFIARKPNNRNLFVLLFGLTALYFASSMVRLLALMAPAFGLLAGIGIIGVLKPFVSLLKEPPKVAVKKKFGLERVGNEYSLAAVFLIFLILMSNMAFALQPGAVPKVYRQAYSPITITAGSLPMTPQEPVREWFDMLEYLQGLQNSKIVVCSWWDYGYWLSLVGNVTSLADNATINQTQIEYVGFTMMANETNSLKMLKAYNAKYVLVFTTVTTQGAWAGYGDEGKWTWMARISGKTNWDSLKTRGFIDEASRWTDETKFGNGSSGTWEWNDVGTNSTIYKLMSYAKHQWMVTTSPSLAESDSDYVGAPIYFKEAYFAGKTLSADVSLSDYGAIGYTSDNTAVGIIPLVCLYEIDWQKYNSEYS